VRRLILNADDLGYDAAVSRGIVEAMTRGIVSSTTFIVNAPDSEDAARAAGGLAVGLHLNLARFGAVSVPTKQLNEAEAGELTPAFVERETQAQLSRLESLLGRPATHIDVHKHLHRHPMVLEGLARAARARGLPVRSIDADMREALRRAGVRTNDAFFGDAGKDPYWTLERLRAHLDQLPEDGVVELMCHPGYTPQAVKSGYGAQREVELATFLSDGAKALLERRGIAFESWAGV